MIYGYAHCLEIMLASLFMSVYSELLLTVYVCLASQCRPIIFDALTLHSTTSPLSSDGTSFIDNGI